jgi:hypothetical protein
VRAVTSSSARGLGHVSGTLLWCLISTFDSPTYFPLTPDHDIEDTTPTPQSAEELQALETPFASERVHSPTSHHSRTRSATAAKTVPISNCGTFKFMDSDVLVIKLANSEIAEEGIRVAGGAPHGRPKLDGTENRPNIEVKVIAVLVVMRHGSVMVKLAWVGVDSCNTRPYYQTERANRSIHSLDSLKYQHDNLTSPEAGLNNTNSRPPSKPAVYFGIADLTKPAPCI